VSLSVRPYGMADADLWNDFCAEALQSTLLHTRCFLSYHGDRFADRSLIIEDEDKCVGLFPAALNPGDATCVVSHPGITYGGVLHHGSLRGERMVAALAEICRHYRVNGQVKLTYKAVPSFYHRAPAQDDLYALFRLGAVRSRCDLSSTIDLQHRLSVSERRRRGLKKANKAVVEVVVGNQHLPALWGVLAENLANKHGVKPVHNLEEIVLLTGRFPNHIRCVCARLDGRVIAGVLLFITPTAHHAQYIASSDKGYEVSALDLLFEYCIKTAGDQGSRWFDFGISNEYQGMVLNDGLYRFKSEFGGGGAVHEFYELNLNMGEH
jgi:Acetyltransferase (GNAT) domain